LHDVNIKYRFQFNILFIHLQATFQKIKCVSKNIPIGKSKNRAESDIWYIENWSVLLDIKIILRTVWQVFFTKEEISF